MAEWFKAAVLKTVRPERVSEVRIPPPPPLFIASTYYAFCVIYAECVNRLSSVRFFQQSGKKSLRRQCFLPKRPGIFPNSQRISTLHLRAFRESSKL